MSLRDEKRDSRFPFPRSRAAGAMRAYARSIYCAAYRAIRYNLRDNARRFRYMIPSRDHSICRAGRATRGVRACAVPLPRSRASEASASRIARKGNISKLPRRYAAIISNGAQRAPYIEPPASGYDAGGNTVSRLTFRTKYDKMETNNDREYVSIVQKKLLMYALTALGE